MGVLLFDDTIYQQSTAAGQEQQRTGNMQSHCSLTVCV